MWHQKLLDTFRTRGRSVTFSIQQDSTTTKYNINQSRGTHPQTRQVRRRVKRWAGLAPPPVQAALPFLWATVLLKFARNWRSQCAKTCDCHSAPWPMGGMNGTVTTRLVEEQQERGVAPFSSAHRENVSAGSHTLTDAHFKLLWSLAHTCHRWRHKTIRHRTGPKHLKCCTCNLKLSDTTAGGMQKGCKKGCEIK